MVGRIPFRGAARIVADRDGQSRIIGESLKFPSALGGAILVLAADIALRLIGTPKELQLGVVTALVGAPFFLALVLRSRRDML